MKLISSLLIFGVFSLISFLLLNGGFIESRDFVVLISLSAVVSLVAPYFGEIQEFSIGGNLVKLKEANEELSATIEQVKQIKISMFRMLLLKSLQHSGGFGSSSLVDSRVEYFCSLIKEINEANCFEDLKMEIGVPLRNLIKSQLGGFYRLFEGKEFEGDQYPKAMQFYIALNENIIDLVAKNRTPPMPFKEKKQDILSAIDAYAQLYGIAKNVGLFDKKPDINQS